MKKLLFVFALVLFGVKTYADDGVTAGTLSLNPGETGKLEIYFTGKNSSTYTSLSFYLYVPDGIEIPYTGKNVNAEAMTAGEVAPTHNFSGRRQSATKYKFMVEHTSNAAFAKSEGVLMTITVNASSTITKGKQDISIELAEMADANGDVTTGIDLTEQPVAAAVGGAPVTIASSGYTVVCNEKALDFSSVSEVTAVYAVSKASSTSAKLTEIESKKVPANTGVIVEGTAGATAFVPFAEGSVDAVSPNVLVGVNEAKALAADEGYILIGGKFLICEAGTLPAHKAYLPASALTAKATELVFDFDTVVTGINEVKADSADNSPVYNLNGARVSNLQKGVYVKNGRKFIVK